MQRLIKVDGKVRTDPPFPAGFRDVINIERTNENFRLIYDTKGRFYKLCRVKKLGVGPKGVPFLVTGDGRTIRYPDPLVKTHDTIQLDIASSKIVDFIKFEVGNLCMVNGGHYLGRVWPVGTITSRERHPGSFKLRHCSY
ncbi:40S ribosomal protein S4-like [Paramacrobiotus metropolitanus]|uniref:40S ribosomal protein S4-like n=1 Tax=Paramacrobiotus metropolitanus TaxID=2943436 RepID=UPI002445DB7F|nr:40S ribosomal protein S4-like [Paramacrobiotus metropolitanus]